MQCFPSRTLLNLLPTAESIGDDEPIFWRASHCRQKFEFADRNRCIAFVFLKSERSSHSTAPGRRHLKINPYPPQHRFFVAHLHYRFVMTMPVHERLTGDG